MPTRFEFERAIRRSGLPPLSRLLALTLATWADVDTGEIPDEHQPAQSVLLEATGMAKGTFLSHRATLREAGWISYTSPTVEQARREHAQCSYALRIPARSGADLAETANTDTQGARSAPDLGQQLTTRVPVEERSTSLPPRTDVEDLCRHLADRVEANGSKRPRITKKWRDAARLLIDEDGRTPEKIHIAIDWCQDDEFWRSNVLSMPKLREKYDVLRLKYMEQRSRAQRQSAAAASASKDRRSPYERNADQGIY